MTIKGSGPVSPVSPLTVREGVAAVLGAIVGLVLLAELYAIFWMLT